MTPQFLKSICILVIVAGSVGCTMTIKPPAETFTGYPTTEQKNIHVGLVLTSELKNTKTERKAIDGTKFVVPIGPNLSANAEELSRRLFAKITVVSDPVQLPLKSVDAILTPTVAYFNYLNVEGLVAAKLEWTFARPNGQIIWAGTAEGQGKQTTVIMYDPEDTVRDAINALFTDSFRKLSQSSELRAFQP